MISLLGKMRKQMNGAVADSMFYYGKRYGLNYGVSLPTVRSIAKEEGVDHDFALYLLRQQVRELNLAAMHIAEPEKISLEELARWEEALINSELAEECAFALLCRAPQLKQIFHKWIQGENLFATYAALMSMARGCITSEELESLPSVLERHPNERIIAQGIVALLDSAYRNAALRQRVKNTLALFSPSSGCDYILDEMSWRMEVVQ